MNNPLNPLRILNLHVLVLETTPLTDDEAQARGLRRHWPRAWFAPETVIFIVVWLVLLAAGREKLLRDPGTFWHLVLGEKLLTTGEFTRHDALTFTFAGKPWLSLQWLGEAAMALAYQAGGWDTLLLLTVTLLAATYTYLASRLMRAELHWLPAAMVLAVVIAASSHHFHARPHLATIALIGLTMAWLCDIEARRASLWRLGWLVPIFAVWSNVHGGVLGGLATVGLAAMGWCGRWVFLHEGPVKSLKHVLLLAALALVLGASLLVNPYGIQMPLAWLRIMSMPLPELIQEHRPLSLLRPEGVVVALLAAAYLWLLRDALRAPHSASRIRITWLLPLVWLGLAVVRVRHAPLFAITAGIALADLLPHTRIWSVVRSQGSGDRRQRRPMRGRKWIKRLGSAWGLPACLVLAALAFQTLDLRIPLIGRGWARHDPKAWPMELLPELREIERRSPGTRIFNALDYGGFLAFYTPGLKTFIDDRCELFGTEFLAAYAQAERSQPERIDNWSNEYGFRFALVRSGSPFDLYLRSSSRWFLLRGTAAAALYQRRSG